MREDLLRELEREYADRRAANEAEEARRRNQMREEYPDVAALMAERENLIHGTLRDILSGKASQEDLPARMEAVSLSIRKKLASHGLPEDYLAPVCQCAVCRDTGYVGETVRDPCPCMVKAYQNKLRRQIGLDSADTETFGTFNLDIFSDVPEEGAKLSQRKQMARCKKICEEWANRWPDVQFRDLLLTGKSGLGKTFLLHAIANRLIERDINVLLISAYRFLQIARQSYFGEDNGLEELERVPVLMLDDVGSEPLMQNVTVEQLFNLINERQNHGLNTLISTNLNLAEFRTRYTERIASRMMDPKYCLVIPLEGRDVREREET